MAETVEVQALACPKCGASIKGCGSCGSCSQLLLVTREYGVLNVTDQDIGNIEIKPPSKDDMEKTKDPSWGFKGSTGFTFKQSALTILGKGSPAVGARLVAMYYADHEDEMLSGGTVASWREVEDYSIAKALSSDVNK